MKRLLLALITAISSYGAVSNLKVDGVTTREIAVSFSVPNIRMCTVQGYFDAALTQPIPDTDPTLYAGSNSCANRYPELVSGNRAQFKLGSLYGNRTLPKSTTIWIKVTDTLDSSTDTVFATTHDTPWGDTQPVPLPTDGTGATLFPDIDWTEAGQQKAYIDPMTGTPNYRFPIRTMGESIAGLQTFDKVFNNGWTNPNNALNASTSGPFASITDNNTSTMYIVFGNGNHYCDGSYIPPFGCGWFPNKGFPDVDDVQITAFGNGSDATASNRIASICWMSKWSSHSDTCFSNEVDFTLPASTGSVTGPGSFPKFFFDGWKPFTHAPTLDDLPLPGGSATVANSVVTVTSGYVPTYLKAGQPVNINNGWYTVGTPGTAKTFTLQESNVNIGSASRFFFGTSGIRVRKKTATGTLNISVGFKVAQTLQVGTAFSGSQTQCSKKTFTVSYAPDGTTPITPIQGRFCIFNPPSLPVLVALLDDGTSRFISPLLHTDYSFLGYNPSIPGNPFDDNDALSLYAAHYDDSVPLGTATNFVLYKVTYDAATYKFAQYAGNNYNTGNPPDGMTWNNLTPGVSNPANTITQKIIAALTTVGGPNYNSTFVASGLGVTPPGFFFSAKVNNVGEFWQYLHGQDSLGYSCTFDLTTTNIIKCWDTTGYNAPDGISWCQSHVNGAGQAGDYNLGFYLLVNIPDRYSSGCDPNGFMCGPWLTNGPTQISFDGIAYSSDTHLDPGTLVTCSSPDCSDQTSACGTTQPTILPADPVTGVVQCVTTNRVAGPCGPNNYGVTGRQCFWAKIPSDIPCNTLNSSAERTANTCAWNSSYSQPANRTFKVGEYFTQATAAQSIDGKGEKFRILSKGTDGSGNTVVMVQRWAINDNIWSQFTGPVSQYGSLGSAIVFSDHLYYGPGGSTHPNGFSFGMACSAPTYVGMTQNNASTPVYSYSVQSWSGGHFGAGANTAGTSLTMSAGGKSALTATYGTGYQFAFNTDQTSFNGIGFASDTNHVETYPNISTFSTTNSSFQRSINNDWRALNPDAGSFAGNPIKIWNHTYTLQAGTQYVYKVDIYNNKNSFKEYPPFAFSSRQAYQDISGPSSRITDSTLNSSCYAYVDEECRAGALKGDFFVSTKNSWIELGGCVVNTWETSSPCVTNLWPYAGFGTEYYYVKDDPLGLRFRRQTTGLTNYGSQFQFNSLQNSTQYGLAFSRPGWLGGLRSNGQIVKTGPAASFDSIPRSNFVQVPVGITGTGDYRVRFGYYQNIRTSNVQFPCTSRQEDCVTDESVPTVAMITPTDTSVYRNNFTGYVGSIFTPNVSTSAIQLGRFCPTTGTPTQTHIVKIVTASTGIDVPGASVSIDMTDCTPNAYRYATISPMPVPLTANVKYYVVSQEFNGGDSWLDVVPVTAGTGAINGFVFYDTSYHETLDPNHPFAVANAILTPSGQKSIYAFVQTDSTATPKTCAGACIITVPAYSGQMLKYRVEKRINGFWIPGLTQIEAVP